MTEELESIVELIARTKKMLGELEEKRARLEQQSLFTTEQGLPGFGARQAAPNAARYCLTGLRTTELGITSYSGLEFPNQAMAHAAREAFATLIDLRRQPGAIPGPKNRDEGIFYLIVVDEGTFGPIVCLTSCTFLRLSIGRLSPCFTTEGSALTAINTVGAERLKQMFNFFNGAPIW